MKILISFFTLFVVSASSAQIRLSAIFNDHMVLQRDKPVKIWGSARPGDIVRVSIGSVKNSTTADKNGRWQVVLPSFSAGGPYTLHIQTPGETKIILDVLIGEVWLCSGQSNMQFRVNQAINAKFEIHRANNSLIRQVAVPNALSFHPQEFIDSTQWIVSSPATTGEFTAVGYFFANYIYERLKVPVGLIYDNWGGSQVESWISRNAMLGSDELKGYASQMSNNWDSTNKRIEKIFRDTLKRRNGGIMPDPALEKILNQDYSFSGWMGSSAPGGWDWIGLPGFRGEGYMEKEIQLDSIQATLASWISLGENDNRFNWYVNGNPLPKTTDKYYKVAVPPDFWKRGKNILILEIGAQSASSEVEMGLRGNNDMFYLDLDGEKISLADASWKMMPVLDHPHYIKRWMNSEGTIIYNAMIHPLIPFGIRGVLWYQGEANVSRAHEYRKTFPLMIESWRKEWQDNFPFLFVQLADFGTNESSNAGSNWAELREAQSRTLQMSGTGMSVTTDIGDPKDIHPKNKQEVGRRLAAIALNDVYGFTQTASGPIYDSVSFNGPSAVLYFKSIGKGLLAKDKNGYLRGFEIAGSDRKFHYAKAFIVGRHVEVFSDSISNAAAVRYGWSNAPEDINLYNIDGFPASPFRTDNWPGLTDAYRFYEQ
jgi:sialate O-acetylesterase